MLFGLKINNLKILFFILVSINLASSCKDEPSSGYSSFILPQSGANVPEGSTFEVKIDFAKNKTIDSVVYFIDSTRITSKNDTLGLQIKTENVKLGNHLFTAKIYHGNTAADDLSTNITVIASKSPDLYTYKVLAKLPHDTTAYTEGFEYHDGFFYESTGEKGHSDIRKSEIQSGRILQRTQKLDAAYFGEGITIIGNKILQLTWQEKTAFVYDRDSFKRLSKIPYTIGREGWGLTFDGQHILASEGSNTIYFLDKDTYQKTGSIDVFDNKGAITNLNELEYIDASLPGGQGKIYANVYQTNDIVIINPASGAVEGRIDLSGLLPSDYFKTDWDKANNVLNGIAYDKSAKRLFVTGKKWPYIFEIKLIKK